MFTVNEKSPSYSVSAFFLLVNLSTEQLLDSLLSMRLLMSLKSKTDDKAAGLSH